MASNDEPWIVDIIDDFIHSSIWLSPIQTFIDANCACFDYEDDVHPSSSVLHEQKRIFQQYQKLVHSLIESVSEDLNLDLPTLKSICRNNHSLATDDAYEQLYSANELNLFIEMMKRKNLILQLQALVNLQMECGLLKQTETSDDRVLQLLLQATASAPMRKSPDVKRNDRMTEKKVSNEPKSIDAVPEEILREKLRELSLVDEGNAAARSSRQNFLKEQRDLIIQKQRNERARELEKGMHPSRPQSAAKVARQAMEINGEQDSSMISNDELEKRRAMADKLRREVVNKR